MFISIAVILLPVWLWLIAEGHEAYAYAQAIIGAWYGQLFLLAVTFSLVYHTLNGIRHMVWDTGYNLKVRPAQRSGHLLIIFTILITGIICFVAYSRIPGEGL
jgi:succinate dehydrogenase / fumarate reductase cytochrome b subunit